MSHKLVALIPARAGSKRAPGKNTRLLNGYPLVAHAIATAREAGIFDTILVSSEDPATRELARHYGATTVERPMAFAQDWSPDVDWVQHAVAWLGGCDAFAILRPTSPFRRGDWVARAWKEFQANGNAYSLRAMRRVTEHPGKMWVLGGAPNTYATPLLPFGTGPTWWHSMPTQELMPVCVQTAALEIAWGALLDWLVPTIAGNVVMPWMCSPNSPEAVDINSESDFERAVELARTHPDWLPEVS